MKQTIIQKISHNYAALLKRHHVISGADVEIQAYGMEIFLSTLLVYSAILITALFLGLQCFAQTIIFLFAYRFLRHMFGGWHANKPSICLIVSWLVWFFSYMAKRYFPFFSIMAGCVGVLLLVIATIKSEENTHLKLVAATKSAMLFLVEVVLYFYNPFLAGMIFYAFFFVGVFRILTTHGSTAST